MIKQVFTNFQYVISDANGKVDEENAIEADKMFDVLMGDIVEPRKRFIEDNALNVQNLDV